MAGVDPDAGMLAVAEELTPEIEWRQGMAESLPHPDQALDIVASQFRLMFFRDRRQALHQMLRVLAPGGMAGVAVWDRLENSQAFAFAVDLLDRVVSRAAAGFIFSRRSWV